MIDPPKERSKGVYEKCGHCGQSVSYILSIDKGTVDIVKAIYTKVRVKGKNIVHPRREMEVVAPHGLSYELMVTEGRLTSNHVGNLSRARSHGLIERVKGSPGSYMITSKGAHFLRGGQIPKYAIVSKIGKKQTGYWNDDLYRVTINDFAPDQEYWEAMPPLAKPSAPTQREMEFK